MLKIKTTRFRNLRSYGKNITTVSFETPGTTLIVGKSDDGGTTNGHGKTTILYCLLWLFYDRILDNVNADGLINMTNKVDLWGEVLFEQKGTAYIIRRWRKGGKNHRENGVQILCEDQDITPAGIVDSNKFIEELLGIDFDLFSRIVIFSATNKSFFDLPSTSTSGTNQSDLVEQLFDLQSLSERASTLKCQISETTIELTFQKRLITQATEQLETHSRLIAKTEQKIAQWEVTTANTMSRLAADVELIENIDFDQEKKHHNTITECTTISRELSNDIKATTTQLHQVVSSITKFNNESKSLTNSTCPYCSQHFAGSQERIVHVNAEIERLTTTRAKLEQLVSGLTVELEDVVALINNTKQKTSVEDFERLVTLSERHHRLVDSLAALERETNPHTDTLQELIDAQPKQPDFDSINTLTNLSEHQQFLLKLLTKKDSFVRKALLHKNLPFLNSRLALYISELGLPHTVEFTPKLTACITQFGREIAFSLLSTGQKARVNFALSLAFCDVLQTLHQKVNIQLFDEVLDIGLDQHGVTVASQLLKRKAKDEYLTIFLISHRDEVQNLFDNTLVVKYIDGFSQVM